MPDANVSGLLSELKAAGADVSVLASLERTLEINPAAKKVVDNALLSRAGFGDYQSNKEKEVNELRTQLTELSSLKGIVASSSDSEVLKLAAERIVALEKVLIDDKNYDPDDVKNISYSDTENEIIAKLKLMATKKEEKVTVPNQNNNDERFVTEQNFVAGVKATAASMAAMNIGMSARIANYLRKADKLGIDVPDEKLENFHTALIQGMDNNETPDAIADKYFGFSAKQTELQTADFTRQLKEAEDKGAREALKREGVTVRSGNLTNGPKHPVFDRASQKHFGGANSNGENKDKEGNDLPRDEKGNIQYFKMRPQSESERRAKHAANAEERWDKLAPHYDEETETYVGLQNVSV